MKSMRIVSLIVMAFGCSAWSQTGGIFTITFSDVGAIHLPDIGRVRLGYPVCRPDGTSFFTTVVDPAVSTDTRLVSVAPDGKVLSYDFEAIPGLRGVGILSVATDDNGATLLIGGFPDKAIAPASLQSSDQFLVRYDLSGRRMWVHGLPSGFRFIRITSYGQAGLLALRMDGRSGTPSVVVLDPEGAFVKSIDMGRNILTTTDVQTFVEQHGLPGMQDLSLAAQTQIALSQIQLAVDGGGVLLLKPGPTPEIFRIDETGAAKSVELKVSQGVEPRAIFPIQSLGLTVVAFGPGERDSSLLQFDPSTGEGTGQLQVTGLSLTSAICNHAGKYYGVRIDQRGAILMIGELKKSGS